MTAFQRIVLEKRYGASFAEEVVSAFCQYDAAKRGFHEARQDESICFSIYQIKMAEARLALLKRCALSGTRGNDDTQENTGEPDAGDPDG